MSHGHRDFRPARLRLEVERLDRARIAGDRDRAVEVLRQRGFVRAAEVAAPLERQALFLEQLHRVVVRDARERRLDGGQLRRVALERRELALPPLEHAADHLHHQALASAMASSRSAYAISGSTIQNSVRWRRVFDFSARNVGPKQ